MSVKKRRLDQLQIVSPCSTDWDLMSGDEKKRFCSECDKFVYDFSRMTRRQVEAIVSIHQGRLDGYEATDWGDSIKKLDDGALAIYRQRLEELAAIDQRGNPEPAELVEWLIRCVEEPATREEGVRKLSDSLSLLEFQREQENEAKSQSVKVEESAGESENNEEDSNEQSDDDEAETRRESVKFATALTQDHKTRLANTLFSIAELSEADMDLVNLIEKLGDERLAPYLVSQLRRVADDAPRFARDLIRTIAWVINDEDLKRLADDYHAAAIATLLSEYRNKSDQQDSTRNRRSDGLTVAAIKRSARLKDFLKLVEYKTKQGNGSGE